MCAAGARRYVGPGCAAVRKRLVTPRIFRRRDDPARPGGKTRVPSHRRSRRHGRRLSSRHRHDRRTGRRRTPGTYARSHHASLAECDAAGQAGRHLWGLIYFCEPFPTRPDVYVLWVRY
ncbi:hypothetical protein ACFQ60_33080 [Streptomyces zhihengii]